MRVIITGATGFIGCALCNEMKTAGHSVTAVIRPGSNKKQKLPYDISIIELELDRLNELNGKYDIFYHLAWNGSSGNERNDFFIQEKNIKYTVEAIKAAKRCGCSKFIGAGSQTEYGVVRGVCSEEVVPKPFMLYGAAKLAAYHMGSLMAEQLGISFVWPRIYSVYGIGENDGTILSYVIKCLKSNSIPELSSCENMWDFLYITDCTNALRLLGEKNEIEGIYNVSYGEPRVLKEFIIRVKEIVNPYGELLFGVKKSIPDKTFWLEPDVSRIYNIGFVPKVSFDNGIKLKMGV